MAHNGAAAKSDIKPNTPQNRKLGLKDRVVIVGNACVWTLEHKKEIRETVHV